MINPAKLTDAAARCCRSHRDERNINLQHTQEIQHILDLKRERNAVILAHLYQRPEVQDIADFVGDSLELSIKARDTQAAVIVFCGVWFMAETAKILNPEKTVLIPAPDAGCPMADMVTPEDVERLRKKHPGAAVVCYVNSSAEIKAASDISCTSANAIQVVKSLQEDTIIFVPDRNLGHYVSRFLPAKRFILFDGFCPTHHRINPADVEKIRAFRPEAPVLVHPECLPGVVEQADFTGSTAQIIAYAAHSDAQEFIIGTESGVLYRLRQLYPDKRFFTLSAALVCPNMKKTTLSGVEAALEHLKYEIMVDEQVIKKAAASLNRMLAI